MTSLVRAVLRPLPDDDRMTVLLSVTANQMTDMAENADDIDNMIELLRGQVKAQLREYSY